MGTIVTVACRDYKIMPFRLLNVKDMPTGNLKTALKAKWRPIFTKMTEGTNCAPDYIPTEAQLQQSFKDAMDRLRDRFSFIFTGGMNKVNKWKIGTWCKKTQRSQVMLFGSQSDKDKLPPANKQNQPHKDKRSFSVQHKKPRKS